MDTLYFENPVLAWFIILQSKYTKIILLMPTGTRNFQKTINTDLLSTDITPF
ncbi:hypothetical protein [Chryseobacterium sp. 7]|uniref:hypothetical protein n=1 Tax=Chryseobacterium sp. 7 TaxID=2035214 RepID=UPI0016038EB9|nr:hypothetical protein [Chryseobacterium sp. 7]